MYNQGKGYRPVDAIALYQGGTFNEAYNDRRSVEVPVPSTASHVELRAIITGHGSDSRGCAEFCQHGHRFEVEDYSWEHTYSEAGTALGCTEAIGNGVVPNQWGSWWFGRGGWCPGQRVDPWVLDVTSDVTPGEDATVFYQGSLSGDAPPDGGSGNILMNSWLVIYE
jgi:hypothetical protein